ncbi:WUSCHEL-related homeobox 9-like [Zingiber officinale]|uniref:WUSCHEL-related homeobox 9-like n=1 Tax=Zingiber officinale TaxID=94328 RepID=UPI001C4AD075|nr:WUSCHEL-related homeobox 9-like [Zingiber officinale]
MASSNKHWTSMFKSKPCINQWQHDHIIHQKNLGCEERSPDPKPRWNPKPEQIRILDAIFNSGMVNPSRDEIRKIRLQLQEFGPVGDANVFYWFQNRKSRSKNKHGNRNHLSPAAARRTPKPSPTGSSSSSSSSSAQSADSGNKTLPLPTRFQHFSPRLPPTTLLPKQMNSLAEPAYQDMNTGIISSDGLYDPETPMQLLMKPDHDDHQEYKLKMQYLQHLYAAAAAAAAAAAVPTSSAATVGSCVNGSPISDIQELMGEIGDGIFDAGAAACARSTVITSEAAYEVAAGRINIRQLFGPEAILLDQSGQPVLTDEWGVTLYPLQHGASYYLV